MISLLSTGYLNLRLILAGGKFSLNIYSGLEPLFSCNFTAGPPPRSDAERRAPASLSR